ncbi:hypothetical protein Hanom_Chr01g00063671 [Helianthus anomalus]
MTMMVAVKTPDGGGGCRQSFVQVLVLRFRFLILFDTASGITDQIQARSTVNPVKIRSFGYRFSGLFRSCFGSSSFVTGSGL